MISCQITKKLQDASGEMPLTLDFEIRQGERIALYGPSGAGKTSTLRMLAGLMKPDSGKIRVGESFWFNAQTGVHLHPGKRNIGFVFQDFALFPNMTVYDNLRFAAGRRKHTLPISDLLDLMELGPLQHRYPGVLSGGQQQRVALARALVSNPNLLLLDEPLSALDLDIRQRLQEYVLNIHQQFGTTIVLISHDLGEVFKLADRVLVMHRGEVIKEGTPEQVFLLPQGDKDFSISGVLLSKSGESKEFCRITVQVQSQMFSFTVDNELVTGVEVGNQIQLSGDLSDLSIRQIIPPKGIDGVEIKP